jgi:tRNA pseudouridine65 synthase
VPTLQILYRDDDLVAVDKPAGLLTHRSAIAGDEEFALQTTRDVLGCRVYAIHRLDRAASGVLLFALSEEAARQMCRLFQTRRVVKRYLAVVRGWLEPEGIIDYPLAEASGRRHRPAVTRYRTLARVELPYAVGPYSTSRYALLEARPESGRFHQIRRHFHHVCHPLVGDTTHGEGRHNRFFRDTFGVGRLLLHARSVAFTHPRTGAGLSIIAPLDDPWQAILARLGWLGYLNTGDQ